MRDLSLLYKVSVAQTYKSKREKRSNKMADLATIAQTLRDQLPRDVESRVVLDVNPDLHGFRVVVGFYRASDNQQFHTAIVFGHKDYKLTDTDLARVCVVA